ncbi:Lrp/AsnC family transcriptional regulator [Actinospica durhamensis]|uniref:Lrp/AsnC family transcriptional regulator n=1 Tax=Actinospica durhamensis TaxID=1508375 RepID=A0A941IS31_9ACTN|nr:Lrp/AsnC family transcriptional regulator [Actinospica durhamensis]MBR7835947.1 Lrp/AsnC family transcriptional regulator [Actinospica durhamensis]
MPQDSVDELDLALINALQVAPRAPWSAIGAALGVDPVTAARRWERLEASGLAWVTCVAGPLAHSEFCMAYIDVACSPGHLDDVAAVLNRQPEVRYLHQLASDYELLVVIAVPGPADVAVYLSERLATTVGVASYRVHLRTAGYREPSAWRLHTLTPTQRSALEAAARSAVQPDRRHVRTDAVDRSLFALLHEDGRMPANRVAERAGISEASARRRMTRLLVNQLVRLRCEVAQSVSGTPVTAVVRLRVAPERLDATARQLAVLGETRMCCALAGPDNLLIMVWLPTLGDLPRFEATLAERMPGLDVADRAVCLRTLRQMGRLLDASGRAVGRTEEGWPLGVADVVSGPSGPRSASSSGAVGTAARVAGATGQAVRAEVG